MPGNSGNKSNKPKLHGSTNSLRDTFNQALNEATTAEQAKSGANLGEGHSNKSNNTNFADLQEWYIKQNAATKSAMAKLTDEPTSVLSKEERDSLYRNVSPYYYQRYLQFRYSDKPEFIRDRMKSFYGFKRNVEDNGLVPKDSAETKPETQYAEQAVKEQANSAKSAEEKTLDDVWADSLGIPRSELNSAKPNTASQPAVNSEKVTPERQAAQDMVNFTLVGDPYGNPNFKLKGKPYAPAPALYERPPAKETGFEPRTDLDTINLVTGRGSYSMSPARYNSLSSILGRNEPMLMGLTAAGVLGLGGLGLYGRYKYGDINQPQTQVPNQIEPEPVNEAVPQAELTPEQQFVLQSTSPFDYAKGANLFDLYDRYGSPDSIDNSVNDEEPVDEAVDESVLPQNPPVVGTNIEDANLVIPDADEAPEELNDAMLDVRPGSFWKTTRSVISPRINAAKNVAQNVFERVLARSKAAPKTSNGSTSNIQDTSNSPVVLNDPNHRKTRDVQNNSVTPEQAAASQIVNQYAGIPVEVVRAKNQPFLTTDAIWNRLRQKGLVSPEEGIRSGLFTPDEVRYITENDLWRYR